MTYRHTFHIGIYSTTIHKAHKARKMLLRMAHNTHNIFHTQFNAI